MGQHESYEEQTLLLCVCLRSQCYPDLRSVLQSPGYRDTGTGPEVPVIAVYHQDTKWECHFNIPWAVVESVTSDQIHVKRCLMPVHQPAYAQQRMQGKGVLFNDSVSITGAVYTMAQSGAMMAPRWLGMG